MTEKASGKPALDAVKESDRREIGAVVTLSTGYEALFVPVAVPIIRDAMARVEYPKPPRVFIESKGREEENPNDPQYLLDLAEVEERRSVAALDVVIIQGVEIVGGLPEDDKWLRKLKFMDKRDLIDLSDYDLEEELDVEFLFKRYVALGVQDLSELSALMGISQEEISSAEESFPSQEEQHTD